MKRFRLILVVVALMCCGFFAKPVFASREDFAGMCGDNVYWDLDAKSKILTIYGDGEMERYFAGGPWNRIQDIETIVIESGVTKVVGSAFYGCSNLTSVTLSDTLIYVDSDAFDGCVNLTKIYVDQNNPIYANDNAGVLYDKQMTILYLAPKGLSGSYSVPEGVTHIAFRAFQNCDKLTTVTLPSSLKEIDLYGFQYCDNLTAVLFKNGVKNIGGYCFDGCSSLASITIPESVTDIGFHAFSNCSSLTGIYVDENNRKFSNDDRGVLFDKKMNHLVQAPGAISGNYYVPSVQDYVSITDSAFTGCNDLSSVTISGNVRNIETNTFNGCAGLIGIYVEKGNPYFSSDQYGVLFDRNKSELLKAPKGLSGAYSIPDGVTRVAAEAFQGCSGLTSLTIPDSVTKIGRKAFEGCSALESVTLSGNLTEIDEYAFSDCSSLAFIRIPVGVTAILNSAFWGCHNLETVVIPTSVTSILHNAFYASLEDRVKTKIVYLHGSPDQWAEIDIAPGNDKLVETELEFHLWGEWTMIQNPTETDAGTELRCCLECNLTEERSVPFEHIHSYDAVVHEPTCTEQGYTAYTCECGDCHYGDYVDPTGHSYYYDSCRYCGSILPNFFWEVEDNDTPDRADQIYDGFLVAGEMTYSDAVDCFSFTLDSCTSVSFSVSTTGDISYGIFDSKAENMLAESSAVLDPGTYYLILERNDEYYTDYEISVTFTFNHAHDYTAVVTEASCTEGGFTTYTCACGETYVADYTAPLGHTYINGICDLCGESDPNYQAPVQNPFTDVPENKWFAEPVLWAVERGITSGTTATTFSPDEICTRAQVVTFLWRAMGEPEPESNENPFTDVREKDYYYKAVLWAVEKGITTGTGEGKFSPKEECTRGQVVTFLWRAMGKTAPVTEENPFGDVRTKDYFYEPVLWAVENGITTGTGEGTFSPKEECTRGQVVTFLYRALSENG